MQLLFMCPMCFGDPNSQQVQGAQAGVLVMLGVVVPLLGGIGFIARSWVKRARALDAQR